MQMVELFAEYDPMGLLPFLRASERYPLEEVPVLGWMKFAGVFKRETGVICCAWPKRTFKAFFFWANFAFFPNSSHRLWLCASGKVCVLA